ncbi:MAG: hypothetical protein AABY61_16005 [Nitrospirota bacterium]|jgi:hypothetical protein
MSIVGNVQWGLVWRSLVVVASIVSVVSCSGGVPPKRVYQSNPPDPSVQTLPLKLAVVELEDGSAGTGVQRPGVSAIPGALYGTELVAFHHTLLGKCVATELKGSKSFASVEYHSNWEKLAEEYKSYDVIVTGRLLQDKIENKKHFYGLSVVGVLFGFLGLPAQSFSREISFNLIALSPMLPDEQLWGHQIRLEHTYWKGLYYLNDWSDGESLFGAARGASITYTDFCTPELLQPALLGMRTSLAAALKHNSPKPDVLRFPKAQNSERSGS